jgi:hypothetical protein
LWTFLVNNSAQLVLAQTLVGKERADLVDHELVHPLAGLFDLLRTRIDR